MTVFNIRVLSGRVEYDQYVILVDVVQGEKDIREVSMYIFRHECGRKCCSCLPSACPIRVVQLASPSKRQCLDTWTNKSSILPPKMVDRLRNYICDRTPVVRLDQAADYFQTEKHKKNVRRSTKNKRSKPTIKISYDMLTYGVKFAHSMAQMLKDPFYLELGGSLKRIEATVCHEIGLILKPDQSRKKNKQNEQMKSEVSNKVSLWIIAILKQASQIMMEQDLMELEEEEGVVLDFLDDTLDKVMSRYHHDKSTGDYQRYTSREDGDALPKSSESSDQDTQHTSQVLDETLEAEDFEIAETDSILMNAVFSEVLHRVHEKETIVQAVISEMLDTVHEKERVVQAVISDLLKTIIVSKNSDVSLPTTIEDLGQKSPIVKILSGVMNINKVDSVLSYTYILDAIKPEIEDIFENAINIYEERFHDSNSGLDFYECYKKDVDIYEDILGKKDGAKENVPRSASEKELESQHIDQHYSNEDVLSLPIEIDPFRKVTFSQEDIFAEAKTTIDLIQNTSEAKVVEGKTATTAVNKPVTQLTYGMTEEIKTENKEEEKIKSTMDHGPKIKLALEGFSIGIAEEGLPHQTVFKEVKKTMDLIQKASEAKVVEGKTVTTAANKPVTQQTYGRTEKIKTEKKENIKSTVDHGPRIKLALEGFSIGMAEEGLSHRTVFKAPTAAISANKVDKQIDVLIKKTNLKVKQKKKQMLDKIKTYAKMGLDKQDLTLNGKIDYCVDPKTAPPWARKSVCTQQSKLSSKCEIRMKCCDGAWDEHTRRVEAEAMHWRKINLTVQREACKSRSNFSGRGKGVLKAFDDIDKWHTWVHHTVSFYIRNITFHKEEA